MAVRVTVRGALNGFHGFNGVRYERRKASPNRPSRRENSATLEPLLYAEVVQRYEEEYDIWRQRYEKS